LSSADRPFAQALLPYTSEHAADPFCEPRPRPTRGMAEEGQARGERVSVGVAQRLVAPNCNSARIKWSGSATWTCAGFSALLTLHARLRSTLDQPCSACSRTSSQQQAGRCHRALRRWSSR